MKTLVSEETVKIPKGVKVSIKCKKVEVSGKFGTLKRDFKHLPIELWIEKGQNCVKARMYFAKSKQIAALRTVCSHIQNLFDGVEKKFEYKMRLVYAHFPINASITNGGKTVEIRNYLGEKNVRVINLLEGVKIDKSPSVKDELVLVGPDIDLVSRSAALIRQSCLAKNKDIRKFLDGVYVSSHGVIDD